MTYERYIFLLVDFELRYGRCVCSIVECEHRENAQDSR